MLCELLLDKPQCKTRSIDGRLYLPDDERKRPDVVFVPMGKYYPSYLFTVFFQLCYVWNNDVHPEHITFGEHQASINNDDIIAVFHSHDIHPYLAKASEGDYL